MHVYYYYSLGAVHEDCCIHPHTGPNPLTTAGLLHWSIWQASTTSFVQERWIKQIIRYLFVVKGSVEVFDRSSGSMRKLDRGDAWILDTGPGYLLKERYDRQSVILNLNFKSVNIKPIYQSNFQTYQLIEKLNREDGIEIISFVPSGHTPVNLPLQVQKINLLFLPQIKKEVLLDPNCIYSVYFLKGSGFADKFSFQEHDFISIEKQDKLLLTTSKSSQLIVCKLSLPA